MTVLTTYKTLYGSHEVKVLSPTPSGATAKFLDDNMRAMADAIDDLKDGVTGNPGPAGAPGTDGADGADGATIRIGTLVSGTDTVTSTETSGNAGDVYVNSSTSALYQCSAAGTDGGNATYTYIGLFQGPQGETGPAGPTGSTGPTGENGADGVDGTTGWTYATANSSATPSIALDDGYAYQCTSESITSLAIATGTNWDSMEGMALVEFYSPASAPSISIPTGWKVAGDDVVSGTFCPAVSTWYTLFINVLFGTVRMTVQIRG